MYTIPVYLLVGIINLFAKKNNYNIKIDDDPDFQIRVKRDVGTAIGDTHDREHIINMLKNHRIERMKRESAKYNFDQLNMPYTNGNPQIVANYTHDRIFLNPYATNYIYDKTASPIVKRSDHYSYNKQTTNFDPFYNVKNSNFNSNTNNGYYNNNNLNSGINNYNPTNGYNTNNYPNNNGYYNNNPNIGKYNNYNQNNGFYNIPNRNEHYNNNIQLSYPNRNTNTTNNAKNNSNNYYNNNNNQNIVSNIQKIPPKNRNNGNIINMTEVPTETSTITILESYIFGFGNKCPVGMVKIGRRCMKEEDLE